MENEIPPVNRVDEIRDELKSLEGKRLTIIVRDDDINAFLSFRNIPKTFIITPDEANTYDLLNNGALLMPADVAAHFGEVLA